MSRYAQSKGKGGGLWGDIRNKGKKAVSDGKKAISAIKNARTALKNLSHKTHSPSVGGALRRNISQTNEIASVGLGGTLLNFDGLEQHPSFVSQPYSTHYNWGNTLPKYYQQFSNGLQ